MGKYVRFSDKTPKKIEICWKFFHEFKKLIFSFSFLVSVFPTAPVFSSVNKHELFLELILREHIVQ